MAASQGTNASKIRGPQGHAAGTDRLDGSKEAFKMKFTRFSGAVLLSLAAALAAGQALAGYRSMQGDGARFERFCARQPDPARQQTRSDLAAERLSLNDSQKALFKALQDERAKARTDFRAAVCDHKPDLKSLEGRLAFRQSLLEIRLAAFKAQTPKLLAFYSSLDSEQKMKFDEMRRRWRRHAWRGWRHRHHHHYDRFDD
jgi:hypothetical protein